MINDPAETLLHELRGSPASLVKLVEEVRWRPLLHVVDVSAEAIIGWRTDDPRAWRLVLEWLTAMDVEVSVN